MKTGILVLADDFTGALDTGMQFAKNGAATIVTTDPDYNPADDEIQVLVIDTETRHKQPEEAAAVISAITAKAAESGTRIFYKKTDSALRGNIGAEIEAMLRASKGKGVHFLPAFPKMDRIVQDGTLYVEGRPVADSVFGKDPFEPITRSRISEILAQQTDIGVTVRNSALKGCPPEGIIVYNTQTDAQMEDIVKDLDMDDGIVLLAGCAGLAASLGRLFFSGEEQTTLPRGEEGLLIVSGSVNEVTCGQIAAARKAGFGYRRLTNREKLTDYLKSEEGSDALDRLCEEAFRERSYIIDTCDSQEEEMAADRGAELGMSVREVGEVIADTLAFTVNELLARGINRMLLLTGGDVLYHTMERMGISALIPLAEVSPGVILTEFCYRGKRQYVLTKSGGFGDEQLLIRLNRMLSCNC